MHACVGGCLRPTDASAPSPCAPLRIPRQRWLTGRCSAVGRWPRPAGPSAPGWGVLRAGPGPGAMRTAQAVLFYGDGGRDGRPAVTGGHGKCREMQNARRTGHRYPMRIPVGPRSARLLLPLPGCLASSVCGGLHWLSGGGLRSSGGKLLGNDCSKHGLHCIMNKSCIIETLPEGGTSPFRGTGSRKGDVKLMSDAFKKAVRKLQKLWKFRKIDIRILEWFEMIDHLDLKNFHPSGRIFWWTKLFAKFLSFLILFGPKKNSMF